MDSVKSDRYEKSFDSINTTTKIIDGGTTPLLQFMDTHINKPFKNWLTEKWAEWIAKGEVKYAASGNHQNSSYEQVVKWVYDVWELVAEDDLTIKGFEQCWYINFDGDYNELHSLRHDRIVNR